MNSEIWVLGDSRKGNTNQAIALAEELGLKFEVKVMDYNLLGILPNFLLNIRPVHIGKKFLYDIASQSLPKLIISSGRRTAPIAIYLKQKSDQCLKIIQIMKPGISLDMFDLVILPQHDSIRLSSSNVIKTIGALTNISKKLHFSEEEFKKNYPEIKKFVGVLIGGDNKSYKYSKKEIKNFVDKLSLIAKNYMGIFFISFSRRTPKLMKKLIRENFEWPNIIYDPEVAEKLYNPYLGILACADSIIITADSISMCSESASTGKPIYIFCPDDFKSRKHKFFIQQLFDLGAAKSFNENANYLSTFSYAPLNEIARVAQVIKNEIL